MKIQKFLLLFSALSLTVGQAGYAQFGQETGFERALNTRDDQPLREFVESKENIDVQNKSKNLEISGDVRFEWRNIQEKGVVFFQDERSSSHHSKSSSNKSGSSEFGLESVSESSGSEHCLGNTYRNLRGGHHVDGFGVPLSCNDFDVEFNLKIKYTYKDAWAKAHLQFDNPAGIRGQNSCFGLYPVYNKNGTAVVGDAVKSHRSWLMKGSGEAMFITLKRAYIGYKIIADGQNRLDIEVGRQKLDDIFDSEIEFTSRFDGILLRFARSEEELFDWYITAGGFVIDERVNHFGYVTEIGFLDILESGFDFRYNFIDWKKRGRNRCFVMNPLGMEFQNSQITLTYTFEQELFCKETPFELYGGFLINHAAKKNVASDWKKKNLGWYAGLYIGNVDKKGDWSLDLEYIVVQAQAVPEYDVGSIGRGNIMSEALFDYFDSKAFCSPSNHYYSSSSSSSSGEFVGYFPRRGNANFVGGRGEFLYALTDNLSIDVIYEFSVEEDKRIGGPHKYHDFEIEAIYAF